MWKACMKQMMVQATLMVLFVVLWSDLHNSLGTSSLSGNAALLWTIKGAQARYHPFLAHSVGMTGLFKQKENEFKSLQEVGSRLVKLVLVKNDALKCSCFPVDANVNGVCHSTLSPPWEHIDLEKQHLSCLTMRWWWTAWLSLHLLSVCFNYIGHVREQHSGMLCHADTAPPAPGLAYYPSLQNPWRKPALFSAICVSEHLAELFGKQFWMRRGYVVNQDYFKLLKHENLGIC